MLGASSSPGEDLSADETLRPEPAALLTEVLRDAVSRGLSLSLWGKGEGLLSAENTKLFNEFFKRVIKY